MRHLMMIFAAVCVGCFSIGTALGDAAPAAAEPTSAPSGQTNGPMKVYITEVVGLVQVRTSASDPWVAAKVHMVVSEGAELRTGPHSSVTCVIPPDQTFTLDRLGTVRVEEAAQHGDKITTDLIMKYGRTKYDIESSGLEHEASIISPSSTLAIRGTNVSLFDQPPFKVEATSFTGRAQFTHHKTTVPVGAKHGTLARAKAGTDGAAQTAVDETIIDPSFGGARTEADATLIASEVSRGAVLSYDPIANIPVITGGRPFYDSELPSHLPGTLDFVLRWTGNADLNIEVGVDPGDPLTNISNGFQLGEFLYPGNGLQNSKSGGHIAFDDRGGPTGGEEIAYWSGAFPSGLYGIAAQSISGASTSFTFNVFANGVPLNMYYFAADGVTEVKSTQVTHTLAPGANDTALTLVPPSALLESIIPDDPAGNPNPGITPGSFTATPSVTPALATPLVQSEVKPVATVVAAPIPVHSTPQVFGRAVPVGR